MIQTERSQMTGLITYPKMGNLLVLDFNNVDNEYLNNFEKIDKSLKEIFNSFGAEIEGCVNKNGFDGKLSIVYLLNCYSHFAIHIIPENKCLSIDFCHNGKHSRKTLRIIEERLCDMLGWYNCTSTINLKRGRTGYFLGMESLQFTDLHKNVKLIYRERTPFQEIRIYDTFAHERILLLDLAIQISSKHLDRNTYTINLVGLVIDSDKVYDDILIIGGGDLLTCKFLLENCPNVKRITLCEIDERVIEITKKFFDIGLESVNKAITEGKLKIVIQDGSSFLNKLLKEGRESTIDAIIVGCTDYFIFDEEDECPSASLYTPMFYETVYKLLVVGGGFSQQITDIYYKDEYLKRVGLGGFKNIVVKSIFCEDYLNDIPLGHGCKD